MVLYLPQDREAHYFLHFSTESSDFQPFFTISSSIPTKVMQNVFVPRGGNSSRAEEGEDCHTSVRAGSQCPFSCHSEAVTDVTAVGIFAFDKLLRSTTSEIATPACALVRNDEKRGRCGAGRNDPFLVIPRQ